MVEHLPVEAPDWDDRYVVLKGPEELKAFGSHSLVGFDDEIAAGVNCCLFVARPDNPLSSVRILLSGWPGCGKSVYPLALAGIVNQTGCPYAYVYMRCAAMVADLEVGQILNHLMEVKSFLGNSTAPALIVFDELDALAQGRAENPPLLRLTMGVMDFLGGASTPACAVILGVTNHASRVDFAVRDQFQQDLHFKLPIDNTLIQILGDNGVGRPQDVVRELRNLLGSSPVTGRGVCEGLKIASALLDLANSPPEQIAECLFSAIPPVNQRELIDYELDHRQRSIKSRLFVEQWLQRAPGEAPSPQGVAER